MAFEKCSREQITRRGRQAITEQPEQRWAYVVKMKSDMDRSHPYLIFETKLISSISTLFVFRLSLASFSIPWVPEPQKLKLKNNESCGGEGERREKKKSGLFSVVLVCVYRLRHGVIICGQRKSKLHGNAGKHTLIFSDCQIGKKLLLLIIIIIKLFTVGEANKIFS